MEADLVEHAAEVDKAADLGVGAAETGNVGLQWDQRIQRSGRNFRLQRHEWLLGLQRDQRIQW